MRNRHPFAVGAVALTAALSLGGCFTGPRPSFVETTQEPTGDAAVDKILERLEAPATGTFTATYTILYKFGGATFPATVARDPDRLSVTIGDVRYLTGSSGSQTCIVSTGACTAGFDEQKISDTGVLHTFAKESAAARLRREARASTGAGESYGATAGGLQVDCVRVVGAGGTTQFCATDDGWLALQDVAEVNVSLDSIETTVSDGLFTPSGT